MDQFIIQGMGTALSDQGSLNFQCDRCRRVNLPLCERIILVLGQLLAQLDKWGGNSWQYWKEPLNPYHSFSDKEGSSTYHQSKHETDITNDKEAMPFI